MIRTVTIILQFSDTTTVDISPIIIANSLQINEQLFNQNKTSCTDTASFTIKHDPYIAEKLKAENQRIQVTIDNRDNNERLFTGVIEPNFNQTSSDHIGDIQLETVDASYLLDENITENAVYEYYKVCDPLNVTISLFHILVSKAGYPLNKIDAITTIPNVVRCLSLAEGESTWRETLDTLLKEFLYVLTADRNGSIMLLPWSRNTANYNIIVSGNKSTVQPFQWNKIARYTDGVEIEWSKTAVIGNALLYRDAQSVSFENDQVIEGVAIAAGDYYPKDSDIREIYQMYETQWLDIPYNNRTSRLKNDDLSLLNTTSAHLNYEADPEIVVELQLFETKRARIVFKNTAAVSEGDPGTRYLKHFEILGNALIRSSKVKIVSPQEAKTTEPYTSTYLFNETDAKTFTNAMAADNAYSDFEFTFGLNRYVAPGLVARIEDRSGISTNAVIYKCEYSANDPVYKYTAVAIKEYNAFSEKIHESSSSIILPVPGIPGTPAYTYELKTSVDKVQRDYLGNNTPAAVSCSQDVIIGNNSPQESTKTIKYVTSATSEETAYTGPVTVGTLDWIEFRLYDGDKLLDRERVPVLSDGPPAIRYELIPSDNMIILNPSGVA
ncbi:MAG: hypothetical protein LBQ88_12475, partial [Treponema sp.]|nr:hypothetical protein [Treponema sp.]